MACILDAYVLQLPVVLYVSTLSAGTYIGQLFVSVNELLKTDGGVVASTVTLVKP